MATRFHGRGASARRSREGDARSEGLGEWWAAVAVIALAALAIVSLGGSRGSAIRSAEDPSPLMLTAIEPSERALSEIERAFATLCTEPVLLAIELEPDCETGVITLNDELFSGFGSAELGPEAEEVVAAAIRIYLERLRALPALWNSLESIEIRGHSDPRAFRTPYATNMVGSQQRPLGVLFFLTSDEGLSPRDREDFERLAVVSGVSFSRPPATCPESTRECYAEWRRVEIRPVLSESLRRGDWSRTLQDVRDSAARIREEFETQQR